MHICVEIEFEIHFQIIKVLRRESYGMSSDAWSVGCCIILISTGQLPWALNKLEDPYIDVARVSNDTIASCITDLCVVTDCSSYLSTLHITHKCAD